METSRSEVNLVAELEEFLCRVKEKNLWPIVTVGRQHSQVKHTTRYTNNLPLLLQFKKISFVRRLKQRARSECTPISVIYEQEVARDRYAAMLVSKTYAKRKMQWVRKFIKFKYDDVIMNCDEDKAQDKRRNTCSTTLYNTESSADEWKENKRLKKFSGFRIDSLPFHDGDGYFYRSNKRSDKTIYLRCNVKTCHARASLSQKENAPIKLSAGSTHNHRPDIQRVHLIAFMKAATKRSMTELSTTIAQIYDEEALKYPDGAACMPAEKAKKKLSWARKRYLIMKVKGSSKITNQNALLRDQKIPSNNQNCILGDGNFNTANKTQRNTLDSEGPAAVTADHDKQRLPKIRKNYENKTIEEEEEIIRRRHERTINMELYCSKTSETVPSYYQPKSIVYHDGDGYFYRTNKTIGSTKYLRCCAKGCKARASVRMEKNAPVKLSVTSPLHNHQPDLWQIARTRFTKAANNRAATEDTAITKIYAEEAERDPEGAASISAKSAKRRMYNARKLSKEIDDKEEIIRRKLERANNMELYCSKTSEIVPSFKHNSVVYRDEVGYFYRANKTKQSTTYLRCCAKGCRVRASVKVEKNAPLKLSAASPLHNHEPDLWRVARTRFMKKIYHRAATENTSINKIYAEEAEQDPEGAGAISEKKAKQRMIKVRQFPGAAFNLEEPVQDLQKTEDVKPEDILVEPEQYLQEMEDVEPKEILVEPEQYLQEMEDVEPKEILVEPEQYLQEMEDVESKEILVEPEQYLQEMEDVEPKENLVEPIQGLQEAEDIESEEVFYMFII